MFRFLLADDHEVFRRGVRSIVEALPDCQIAGEAADGREAVELTMRLNPEVVILDVMMPTLNGLDAMRQILKARPRTKVLVLTMHDSDSLIVNFLNAGARGYILKSDAAHDLAVAVESLRRNKTFFTSRVTQMMLEGFRTGTLPAQEANSGAVQLTPRQREIVQLLAEGKSSKEVAAGLGMSVKTADTHRANIMRKLQCHSVCELVRYAIRNEIIEA